MNIFTAREISLVYVHKDLCTVVTDNIALVPLSKTKEWRHKPGMR